MKIILWILVITIANRSYQGRKENYLPEIIDNERTFMVKLNDSICLPCKIKQYGGKRRCLFYWTKDGSVVLQWPRYRVKQNKCLRIKNIRSSDHAKFVCHARSAIGEAEARAVRYLVVTNRDINATYQPEPEPSTKFKPSVPVPIFFRDTLRRTHRLLQKYFYIGRRAKLKCAIIGSPKPKIKWYLNGVPLDNSELVNIRPRSYALVIDRFTPHHIGNYTCVGSNGRGIVNMSFIVRIKFGDPPPPLPIKQEKVVSEGDNVTLHCKKPENKVKVLVWEAPFGPLSKLPRTVNDNGSMMTDFHLYNISQKMHGGLYRCLALYKRSRSRKPVPVKIIDLKIETDTRIADPRTGSPNNEILLVKIAVPVMGSLLTLVVVIICFRCSRKTTVNNPAKTKPEEEENTLSMHILPNTPTGTLRIHKSLQEFPENDIKTVSDVVIPCKAENTDSPENEKNIRTSNNSQCPRQTLYQNSHKPYTKPVSHGSCYSIPDSNTSKKCSSSNENLDAPPCEKEPQNSKLQTNNIETSKKHRHNKRHHKRTKHGDISTNCENIHPYTSQSGTVDENIPASEIPESSEEDDQLLQREMKNWEPLIRDSTSYVGDRINSDGDSLRYDRTNSEGKTFLMSQHSNDTGIGSDGTQHIVI